MALPRAARRYRILGAIVANRRCGKMYSNGRVFDVCDLERGHEPPHHAGRRGFTFSDIGGIVAYDKTPVARPGLDAPTAPEVPLGNVLPEPAPGSREASA